MWRFPVFQINGVDVTDARHDQAVALLKGSGEEITLVVYREHLVGEDGLPAVPELLPPPLAAPGLQSSPTRSPPVAAVTPQPLQLTANTELVRTVDPKPEPTATRTSYVDQFKALGQRPNSGTITATTITKTVVSQSSLPSENHHDAPDSHTTAETYPAEVSPRT